MLLLRLLARWAAEIGGLKVPEEDLLDEVWSVGAGEWEQLVEEAETAGDGCSVGTPQDRPERASPCTETTERMPKTDVRNRALSWTWTCGWDGRFKPPCW